MAESLVHILKFTPSGLTKEAVYNDHNYKFLKLIINFVSVAFSLTELP